jgi:hypothetical protein
MKRDGYIMISYDCLNFSRFLMEESSLKGSIREVY